MAHWTGDEGAFSVGKDRTEVDGKYLCKGCGLMLDPGEFNIKRSKGYDYLAARCKECESEKRKSSRKYLEARKRIRVPIGELWIKREGKMMRVVALCVGEEEKME